MGSMLTDDDNELTDRNKIEGLQMSCRPIQLKYNPTETLGFFISPNGVRDFAGQPLSRTSDRAPHPLEKLRDLINDDERPFKFLILTDFAVN